MRNPFARVAGRAVERPLPVVMGAVFLTLIGAIAALRLEADAGTATLVDRGSETYAATQRFHEQFGDDAVVVLVKGDLRQLVLTKNLGRLLALEACLSGKAPNGQVVQGRPAPAPCQAISEADPSFVVYGPATFLNQFAIQAQRLLGAQAQAALQEARQAAQQAALNARRNGEPPAAQRQAALLAGQAVLVQFQQQLQNLAIRYGQTGIPRLNDPRFVQSVVFDPRLPGDVPKARFSYLFPSSDAALISVRLRPELSESERRHAISLFRDAVADPTFRLRGISGTVQPSYVVSGVPVVLEGLSQELSTEIFILLAVALVVMAITLALVFRSTLRLLPLGIALGATGICFGFLSLAGGSLTMASIAVLPVLIGLAVDYAIQFHARFTEAAGTGSSAPRAAVEAAAAGGPVIATAGLATVAGLLVLLLSPIPMVRGFALLLVIGIVLAFLLALTTGLATLSLIKPSSAEGPPSPARTALRRAGSASFGRMRSFLVRPGGALERAGAQLATARSSVAAGSRAAGKRALAFSIAAPGRVLAVATVLAVAGWVAGTRVDVISDLRQLLPRDLPELQNVDELQEATGVSGEVDVTVTAPDLTDPELISWMRDFEQRVLTSHGFGGQYPSCRADETEICPAVALPDLFGDERGVPTQDRIRRVLALLPPYFKQAVVTTDPETGKPGNTAVIAFGIKVMPFDQQKELIDDIRSEIDPPGSENDPPAGVEAEVVGLPVLAADANSALEGNRYLVTVAGLVAVALALLAVYRRLARALVPLIPIVLATGWASLVLYVTGVPLNPMSATLGALVIAIATEFSVLLSARFHEERRGGGSVGEALRRAYARTGAAVMASGITAIAGFAVLVFSDIRMLRDFGLVTVFDLGVALAGVMLVLPAALVWAEGGFEPLPALVSRLRRRGRPAPADAG